MGNGVGFICGGREMSFGGLGCVCFVFICDMGLYGGWGRGCVGFLSVCLFVLCMGVSGECGWECYLWVFFWG